MPSILIIRERSWAQSVTVSTVRVLHKLQNLPTTQEGQIHYKMLLDSFKKERREPVKQATPMTHRYLLKLVQDVKIHVELKAVAWMATLVGFSMLLRVSNLGPPTHAKFNPEQHFARSDLMIKEGLWALGVRWTKTLQSKNRVNWSPLVPVQNKLICPRHWVLRMVRLIPAGLDEPLFLVREGGERYPHGGPDQQIAKQVV